MDATQRIRYEEDAPATEPMRPSRRSKPTREDIKIRRRQQRAQQAAQVRTATVTVIALRCQACGCQGYGVEGSSRCPACASLAVESAYGEGAQQYIIPTEKLPFIPEEHTRRPHPLAEFLPDLDLPHQRPSGFDEPFQQDRFNIKEHGREVRRQRNQMPDAEKTPEGRGADMLADMIGEIGTVRTPNDVPTPGANRDERRMNWIRQRWNQTYEPIGYNEEGRAHSRRNTRARYKKFFGSTACEHENCPPWEHNPGYRPKYSSKKKATVLTTQIERANPGDMLRTPQGQTVTIKKVRPHETENDKVYVDTDQGTSLMSRGTDVELVPHNSQQQELPGSGIPGANTGRMPGAGSGAGGEATHLQAPTCPVDGAKMVFRNQMWICPVDGTTAPTAAAPAGMMPTDNPNGHLLNRPVDRPVPQTHLWASRYNTIGRESLVVRSAKRVLSTMEENR